MYKQFPQPRTPDPTPQTQLLMHFVVSGQCGDIHSIPFEIEYINQVLFVIILDSGLSLCLSS